jgi:hypothetical protein
MCEGLGIPAGVRADDLVIPVGLDSRLEGLAVRGAGVGDVVVAEPALKLRLVPLIVDCFLMSACCCIDAECACRAVLCTLSHEKAQPKRLHTQTQ